MILSGFVISAMVGEVNRQLPDDRRISYLWGYPGKVGEIRQEYKRLYPHGRLANILTVLEVLAAVAMVAIAVLIGRAQLRTTLQEYAYDALGRRVALRTRRDSSCGEGDQTAGYDCLQTMERFVWDGTQLLVELRDHGGWREGVDTLNLNGTSGGNFFGTVQYTNAPAGWGMTAPLQVQRMNVTGSGFVPQASWRGTLVAGTTVGGKNVTSYQWPARRLGDCLASDGRFSAVPDSEWLGSLAAGKADANGLIYTANGYYDPRAGRFMDTGPVEPPICDCDRCPEDTGGNNPVTPPTVSGGGGGGGGGGQPSQTPQKSQTNLCPLVAPTGKYRTASGIDARFDPTTAGMLSTALANLNQQGITPVITSGFRSPALQAALRNTNSPNVTTPAEVSWHEVGGGGGLWAKHQRSELPCHRKRNDAGGICLGRNL